MKPEVVVLCHPNAFGGLSVDVLLRKDVKKKKPRLVRALYKNQDDYTLDCSYVKDFLSKHKDYEYVFSQDFEHSPSINAAVLDTMMWIASKFKYEVVYDEYYDE